MRNLLILFSLIVLTLSASATKRVTVDQLEKIIVTSGEKSDVKLAKQLSDLELVERIDSDHISRLRTVLPGSESRRALDLLADMASFLNVSSAKIPSMPKPELSRQRQIIELTVNYVVKVAKQLPNLYATRETESFEDTPSGQQVGFHMIPYKPLHSVSKTNETVFYRDGREMSDSESHTQKQAAPIEGPLWTRGEFGPILGMILVDGSHGVLTWSHWEQDKVGLLAVFQFQIPAEKSHYDVTFCCVDGKPFKQMPAYHGELAVDPVTGTIYRLKLIADPKSDSLVTRADLLVEYGSVELGGKNYICPLRSISVFKAPISSFIDGQNSYFSGLRFKPESGTEPKKPAVFQTRLNEVTFRNYHLFHAEARILP